MTNTFHRLNSSSSDTNFKLSYDSVFSKRVPAEKFFIDSIPSHNHPDHAEIFLPDGRRFCWYFAIGSMTNPISLYLRDLTLLLSYPATCLDHKINFPSNAGMSDIEACPDAEFDGIVHLLTNEQMMRLDGIEVFYHRIQVICIDYQHQIHTVYAYQMNINASLTSPPHERYLDTIIKGCEYYAVRSEYINQLRNEQPVITRKHSDSFQSFTDFPSNVSYSLDDLEKHNGSDSSLPLWICVNGKILEYAGLPPTDHPDYEFERSFQMYFTRRLAGREITNVMAKTLYDLLYELL